MVNLADDSRWLAGVWTEGGAAKSDDHRLGLWSSGGPGFLAAWRCCDCGIYFCFLLRSNLPLVQEWSASHEEDDPFSCGFSVMMTRNEA